MMKDRCYGCYSKLKPGTAICDVCKMPDIHIVGNDPEGIKMKENLGQEYREMKLGGISISFTAYKYGEVDGCIKEIAADKVKIADAVSLKYDKTVWMDEQFARIDTDREMDIELILDGEKQKKMNLKFKPPKMEDFWRVGIRMIEGFQAVIRIGNEKVYTETAPFSLI